MSEAVVTVQYTPLFMVRVAGLPVSAVHRLRCPDSIGWADEVLERESAMRARAARISDLLHELVKGNEDELSRRRLLALRRQVFGNTLPPDPAGAVALVGAIDERAAAILSNWIADLRALEELRAHGAVVLDADLSRSRIELRRLAEEQRLLLGLSLASPTLVGQLRLLPGPDARASGNGKPDRRARRVERSVCGYLYRTACKTSPFSTFTGVGLGYAESPGTAAAENGSDAGRAAVADARVAVPEDWSSHVRLNVAALGRLTEAILAHPARRGDLPVELASGWQHDEDRVRYVRRWVKAGDATASVSFDAAREQLFFLRRSGLLDRLITLFLATPRLRCADVVSWLGRQEGAAPADCERYLSILLDLGMLRVDCLDIDVHAPEPLCALRDALLRLDRPWASELAGRLAAPIGRVNAYPGADAGARRRLLAELRTDLQRLMSELGAGEDALPQALLYEDVRAGDRPLRFDLHAWIRLIEMDLRIVERLLPAFDPTVAHRVTFKGFFLARFGRGGRCDDVLKLVTDFHEDFYDQYVSFTADRQRIDEHGEYVPEENWMGLPGITALDDARRQFIAYLRDVWASETTGGRCPEEIRLGHEMLAQVAHTLAPVAGDAVAQSHFLQFVARDPDPLVVLNQSYGGLSFAFSRFTHCFEDIPFGAGAESGLSTELRRRNREIQPPGAVFAEVTGGAATTNLNLHGRLTDYEIVSPGESSCVPADQQIPLDDLYIVHDAGNDRLQLRSRKLDRQVIPLYFGYLIPAALPEVTRTLLLLSPTSMGRLDVWGGVPQADAQRGVTVRPRVRLGSLVLSRRSWHLRAADLPARAVEGSDHEWFLNWRRWWRSHALPEHVFATVYPAGGGGGRPAKPQYVDAGSYLSLAAFVGMIRTDDDPVVLREMLPRADQLHLRSAEGEHVAEFAVQTHGGPGQTYRRSA